MPLQQWLTENYEGGIGKHIIFYLSETQQEEYIDSNLYFIFNVSFPRFNGCLHGKVVEWRKHRTEGLWTYQYFMGRLHGVVKYKTIINNNKDSYTLYKKYKNSRDLYFDRTYDYC